MWRGRRPRLDEPLGALDLKLRPRCSSSSGLARRRGVYPWVTTQTTVSLGDGERLVALEQVTYRASEDDCWEPGMAVRLDWHPEHCLVRR